MDIVEKKYIEIGEDEQQLLTLYAVETLRGIINSGLSNHITIKLDKESQTQLRLILEAILRVEFERPNILSEKETIKEDY